MSAHDHGLRHALEDLVARVDERIGGVEGKKSLAPLLVAVENARKALTASTREFFVVVSGSDLQKSFVLTHEPQPQSFGPIVFESYLNKATRENAEAFRARLGNSYGWTRIGRLIVEDWPQEQSVIASTDFWEVGETP